MSCRANDPCPSPAVPLSVHGAGKSLAGRPVLRDVSFRCPSGTITALLGPNGAGKTTTVALATGLRRPDSGLVHVFGRDATAAAARLRFSLVPQDIAFPDPVGVRTCLDFVEQQRPRSPFVPGRAGLCEELGITELLDRRVGALSGGQRRRLALALGFVRAPGLLIMDEATTNLDEASRATTWRLVREYAAAGGAALVTTHILADVDSHADRVVALAHGTVVLQSSLTEARERLGGSRVSARVDAPHRTAVLHAMSARGHGAGARGGADELRWRTSDPLSMVADLAAVAPHARDLQVRPVPLDELLDAVTAPTAIHEREHCADGGAR